MKKITALLLCFLMLCAGSVAVFAAGVDDTVENTVISVTVPDSHKLTVTADAACVFYEGFGGEEFVVERLSKPRLLIRPESGKVLKSVTVNGADVTESLYGGYLELPSVYEDKAIVVTTDDMAAAPKDTYTVKGVVTIDGQPLSGVELELRSTLKTVKTDENGNFVFEDVEPSTLTMTVLKDGKVIGYLSFELKADNKAAISVQENGTYTVSVGRNGDGVQLHLALNEELGLLAPIDVETVQKSEIDTPETGDATTLMWWWLLLGLSAVCIAALEAYRRKKLDE